MQRMVHVHCTSIACSLPKYCQINLRLPRLEKHLHVRITDRLSPILPLLGSALLLGKFPVVLEEQMDQGNLDVVRGKEPSRTNMHAMSEAKVLRAGEHELVVAFSGHPGTRIRLASHGRRLLRWLPGG